MTAIATNIVSKADAINQSNSIRVMIVDDSVVVRGLVSRWVDEQKGLEAVGKCTNGLIAVEKAPALRPDIIILDIEMPVMNGLEALPKLLKAVPGVKIIMASTLTQRNAEISLKALSLGAVDYVPKPVSNSGVTTSTAFKEDLIKKIIGLGKNRIRTVNRAHITKPKISASARPQSKVTRLQKNNNEPLSLRPFSKIQPRILVIGSSTGGPPAVISLLEGLAPVIKKMPILITQHMPATFTKIFAGHLERAAGIPSDEGKDEEHIVPGHIYVAPGGKHMIVERKGAFPVIRITDDPEVNFCKPAVDPLFDSVAKIFGPACLSVVLTGMGNDGSSGAVKIADAGGTVIAQDEETSVVWGMPGATAKAGACSAILPLNQIAPKLKQLITG